MWGPTGITRLFNTEFGGQISWLLPGALVMGAVLLAVTVRAPRTDRRRAALLLWGGSLVITGLVFSLAKGIIHPYYAVALAAPLGGLVGMATMGLWERRELLGRPHRPFRRTRGHHHLERGSPGAYTGLVPGLRPFVALAGTLGVLAILALPLRRPVPKLAAGGGRAGPRRGAGCSPVLDRRHGGHPARRGHTIGHTGASSQGGPGGGGPGGGFPGGGLPRCRGPGWADSPAGGFRGAGGPGVGGSPVAVPVGAATGPGGGRSLGGGTAGGGAVAVPAEDS